MESHVVNSSQFASDLYPTMGLNTQLLGVPPPTHTTLACEACNLRPQPQWALGTCQLCDDNYTIARNNPSQKYFSGRRLGDIRQTSTLPKVLPDDYPAVRAAASPWCQQFAADVYGASWQFYSTYCE